MKLWYMELVAMLGDEDEIVERVVGGKKAGFFILISSIVPCPRKCVVVYVLERAEMKVQRRSNDKAFVAHANESLKLRSAAFVGKGPHRVIVSCQQGYKNQRASSHERRSGYAPELCVCVFMYGSKEMSRCEKSGRSPCKPVQPNRH